MVRESLLHSTQNTSHFLVECFTIISFSLPNSPLRTVVSLSFWLNNLKSREFKYLVKVTLSVSSKAGTDIQVSSLKLLGFGGNICVGKSYYSGEISNQR